MTTKVDLNAQVQGILRPLHGGTGNQGGIATEQLIAPFVNDSGGTLDLGTVVTRTAADPKLHATTTAGEKVVGVIVGRYNTSTGLFQKTAPAADETAAVCLSGRCDIRTATAAARGDYLSASTTTGEAGVSSTAAPGSFGYVLYQVTADVAQALIGQMESAGQTPPNAEWFNVEDYGAVHDGSTDDRDAIQAAIDAAEAAGGGVVYFPAGVYRVNGALQDGSRSNAQILVPIRDIDSDEQLTIHLLGATPPPPIVYVAGAPVTPDVGAVIKGTLNSGAGGALIGGWGPAASSSDFTLVHVKVENLTFRMPTNPVLSAVNFQNIESVEFHNVVIDSGSYDVDSMTEPTTTTSWGLRTPGNNNGANTILSVVNVIGFYNGIEVNEHTQGWYVNAWACKIGATFPFAYHATHFNHLGMYGCEIGIKVTGDHYFSIELYNIEHEPSGWMTTDYDISDASDHGLGHIFWHVVLGGTGVDHTFTVDGGANLHLLELGDDPFGGGGVSYATPGIVLGTAAAAGAADSVIRSDSTIAAFDATVPTTAAFSDASATGSAAYAARRDHRHGMPANPGGFGPLLISDTPSTPLVFADLLQNEAQDDLLYEDV